LTNSYFSTFDSSSTKFDELPICHLNEAFFYQIKNPQFRLRAVDAKDEVEGRIVSVDELVVGATN